MIPETHGSGQINERETFQNLQINAKQLKTQESALKAEYKIIENQLNQKKAEFKKLGMNTETEESPNNKNMDLLLDAAKPSLKRLTTLKTQHTKVYQSVADFQKHQKSLLMLDSMLEIPEDHKMAILANHSKARDQLI